MIQALERETLPVFTSEQLGALQIQMLISGGEAARDNRVEIIAEMALRCWSADESPRLQSGMPQKFILDGFSEQGLTSFRYQHDRRMSPGAGFELEHLPLGTKNPDTDYVIADTESPEAVVNMLMAATSAVKGTNAWPRPVYQNETNVHEHEESTVMGSSYGGPDVLLRPCKLLPMLGSIMVAAGNTLSAARPDAVADVRLRLNAGKHLYKVYDDEQTIDFWAKNELESADFSLQIKPFGGSYGSEQIAFTRAQLVQRECGVRGRVRQTVTGIEQRGEEMFLRRRTKIGDLHSETTYPISLDGIVEMAQRVEQVTKEA